MAVDHYVKASRFLDPIVILAAQEYAKRHAKLEARTVAEAVTEFLAFKKEQNKSPRHIQTLKGHLTKLKASLVMNIATVTTQDLSMFLANLKADKKPVSARRRQLPWIDRRSI